MLIAAGVLILFGFSHVSGLWSQGVVHYNIDSKDYDIHSQDQIISALTTIENEICVKFFKIPANYSVWSSKTLLISNPQKLLHCDNHEFDLSKNVVLMPIGYKCMNEKDLTRIVVDMLRASIQQSKPVVNSYELLKKFREMNDGTSRPSRPSLIPPNDRDYINAHYRKECDKLASKPNLNLVARRNEEESERGPFSEENKQFFANKQWPLGIVMYEVDASTTNEETEAIKQAISVIEYQSCIVFHQTHNSEPLKAKNKIVFTSLVPSGSPSFGFVEGVQFVNVKDFVHGAPRHKAHVLNNLLRILGIPMMSNRPDRENYININWNHVQKGKEHLLEKDPSGAWFRDLPYDFRSAGHAAANYLCDKSCSLGAKTVQPLHDHLWHRTMSMGDTAELSNTDVHIIRRLYDKECAQRYQVDKL